MAGPALILRELHRLRRHVVDLETKIEQGPKMLRSQQLRLANQEAQLKQAQDALKQVKVQIHAKEVSVKATEDQIAKYEKQLNNVSSKKEYDALRSQIAHEKEIIGTLEDAILALMEEAEEKAKALPPAEAAVQKAKAEAAQAAVENTEKLQRFAAERDRATAELAAVEATLPVEVKAWYLRLITAKGADAMAGVQGRNCTACYTEITSQMAGDLKQENYVVCKNCGRILYPEA